MVSVPILDKLAAVNPVVAIVAATVLAAYLDKATTTTPPIIFAIAPKFAPTPCSILAIP